MKLLITTLLALNIMSCASQVKQVSQNNSENSIVITESSTNLSAQKNTWFQSSTCEQIEIKKYKSISNHKVVAETKLTDVAMVKRIFQTISALPSNGDMMVSFGPDAAHTDVIFYCGKQKEVIEVYGSRIKTPSTGFTSPATVEEKQLIAEFENLLANTKSK